MLRRHTQLRSALRVLADALTAAGSLALAYLIRFSTHLMGEPEPWVPGRYAEAWPFAVLLSLVAFSLAGAYRGPAGREPGPPALRSAIWGVAVATLLLFTAALLYRDEYEYSRGLLALFGMIAVPAVYLGRFGAHSALTALFARGIGVRAALVAGSPERARHLMEEIGKRPWAGVRIVGLVEDPEELPREIARLAPDGVFIAWPAARYREQARSLELLSSGMVDILVVPDLGTIAPLNPDVSFLSGLAVLTLLESPFYGLNRMLKRGMDLLLSASLLIALAPLLIGTALAILLTSGRPVLYRQERMGLDGRCFFILKFRSMRRDAELDTGAVWARRGDPRCTPLGRILRRFSIDELPQLLNVLMGRMSLVGPRPERPHFIEIFRARLPRYMLRHRIPAGLTGWAQVHGLRGETDVAERLRYDLRYLERWSIGLDLEILVRTLVHIGAARE